MPVLCVAHRAAKDVVWENRADVDATSPVPFGLFAHVRSAIFAHMDPLPCQVATERAVLLCDYEGLAGRERLSLQLCEGTGQWI